MNSIWTTTHRSEETSATADEQTWRRNMRKIFWPDVQIRQKKIVAWTDANKEPFNHRRRCEMNSGTCWWEIWYQ